MGKISIQARILKKIFRLFVKSRLQKISDPAELKDMSRNEGLTVKLMGCLMPAVDEKLMIGHIYAEWQGPAEAEAVMLYFHGGAFVVGSPKTHRPLVKNIVKAGSVRALSIDYRLAPEHKFPAALEDAERAYDWLLEKGHAPENIAVAGDSAGGGLALSLLLKLKESGKPLPACAAALSPWTDLTGSGASVRLRQDVEDMLDGTKLRETAALYHGEADPANPLISPLFGNLADLPPLLVQIGTDEILWDDSHSFAEKARQAGTECTLEVFEKMPHAFQLGADFVPEAREALRNVARFIENKTGRNVSS